MDTMLGTEKTSRLVEGIELIDFYKFIDEDYREYIIDMHFEYYFGKGTNEEKLREQRTLNKKKRSNMCKFKYT